MTIHELTAEQAIGNITSKITTFMGYSVPKYGPTEVREQLTLMAESGELSPNEYWRALKLTYPSLVGEGLKNFEFYHTSQSIAGCR